MNLDSGCVVGKADSEGARSPRWLYSDFVVDGTLNPLFATEISFSCLNRNVTEQKLDLLQFPSRGVAKRVGIHVGRRLRSSYSEQQILLGPNQVGEELLWALGAFVSTLACETSFAVLL